MIDTITVDTEVELEVSVVLDQIDTVDLELELSCRRDSKQLFDIKGVDMDIISNQSKLDFIKEIFDKFTEEELRQRLS